jgi:predicted dithiol-disulfide oxidoreductase (DUF899 family)
MYNFESRKYKEEDQEMPGASVFLKEKTGDIYRTYSTYARGLEMLVGTYSYLDLLPRGRDEEGLPFPMAWVRHHDSYEGQPAGACCESHP